MRQWEAALASIFADDQALVAFVQRLFGYALMGNPVEHKWAIFHGKGRNGKSLILEVLASVLGKLASPIKPELILRQSYPRDPNAPDPAVLTLQGKRLVWASETGDGRALDCDRVKRLTGGDTLEGRHLHAKHSTLFAPSHLLILATNHPPKASADDFALWARTFLVPFTVKFTETPIGPNERLLDPNLKDHLISEQPGILAWLVRGALAYGKEGLNPPDSVKAATDAYKTDCDLTGQFLADCCTVDPQGQAPGSELYKAFKKWCEENGHHASNSTRFGLSLAERFVKVKKAKGNYYQGLSLNQTGDNGALI